MGSFTKKVNGELKARRLETKPKADEEETQPAKASLTNEDLDAAVEVGELRARLPKELLDEVADELEGKSYREKRDALRWLARGQGGRGETPTKSRDEKSDATRTTRGAPPANRDAAPRPRSLQEFRALAAKDPKAFEALNKDPNFDPSELPYTLGR